MLHIFYRVTGFRDSIFVIDVIERVSLNMLFHSLLLELKKWAVTRKFKRNVVLTIL